MKKIISLFILSTLVFTACTGSKWDRPKPEITPEQRAYEEKIITEQQAILEKDPTNIKAMFEVAFEYQFLGDYKKAVEYYEKVLENDKNHIVALNNLADIYEQLQEYELAADYIKKLYPLMPDSTEAIRDTVRILLLAGDDFHAQEALDNFAKVKRKSDKPDPETTKLISSLKQQIEDYKNTARKQQVNRTFCQIKTALYFCCKSA